MKKEKKNPQSDNEWMRKFFCVVLWGRVKLEVLMPAQWKLKLRNKLTDTERLLLCIKWVLTKNETREDAKLQNQLEESWNHKAKNQKSTNHFWFRYKNDSDKMELKIVVSFRKKLNLRRRNGKVVIRRNCIMVKLCSIDIEWIANVDSKAFRIVKYSLNIFSRC